jgi:hypothetical protein
MDLKCLHRIVIVRGHKHHHRHVRGADLFDHVEPAHARHLYIEEKNIEPALLECGNHFPAIAAFAGHLNFFLSGKQKAQPLSRQRLIVRNKGS